jgi:hypothetical protein
MPKSRAKTHGNALSLCQSFLSSAYWVWERRGTAKRMSFAFSEETITETILLDLGTMHPQEITVLPFNKREEGKTGADWEWCFYTPHSQFVRMLVQAKVLDDNDENYAHLDREIGSSGVLQIERLIANAQSLGIPAIYAFYNNLRDVRRLPKLGQSSPPVWGISVAFADTIYGLLPSKSFDSISPISVPWAALVCPDTSALPVRVVNALDRLRLLSRDVDARVMAGEVPFRVPGPAVQDGEPPYMAEVRDLPGITSRVARRQFIERMAARYPGRDGLILIGERSK